MVELPCPHCGTLLSKPWWQCVPMRTRPDFVCHGCDRSSYFAPQFRGMGGLLGSIGGLVCFFLTAHLAGDAWMQSTLGFYTVGLIVTGVPFWLLSSFSCYCSNELVPRLLGERRNS